MSPNGPRRWRAAAFKAFCQQLSKPAFLPLTPVLLPWVERLALPEDFSLEALRGAGAEAGWLWQHQAGRFLGSKAQGPEAQAALDAIDALGASPNDLVREGAAKGLADAALRQGREGVTLIADRMQRGQSLERRRLGSRALLHGLPQLWQGHRDAVLTLLRAAASDPDGRVRRGVGSHAVGVLLRGLDPAAAEALLADWRAELDPHLRQAAMAADGAQGDD